MPRLLGSFALIAVVTLLPWASNAQAPPSSYAITTVAGSDPVRDGGTATAALLASPADIAFDREGNLYIAETARVRKVTPGGVIGTIAGNGIPGHGISEGLPAAEAQLFSPSSVAVDASGDLYIADEMQFAVWKVTPDGIVHKVAGAGAPGFSGDGGPATEALLNRPTGVAVDAAGNLYVADSTNRRIRRIGLDGVITTVAGNGTRGFSGDGGPAIDAQLGAPVDVAVDAAGHLYIADAGNHRIRMVAPDGVITTVAGNGQRGFAGDGGPAIDAQLNLPSDVAVNAAGELYISDRSNNVVRKVSSEGVITSVAGMGTQGGFSGDGGSATTAQLAFPKGLAFDAEGSLFIADSLNHRIRKIDSTKAITTVAGRSRFGGDGELATAALLFGPSHVATGGSGNLYIADTSNHRVRKVTPDGLIHTVAGNGSREFSGDGGSAVQAGLLLPAGVAVDSGGNLYIADSGHHRVRRVAPAGVITTVAGNGERGFDGDAGPAIEARLNFPNEVAVDAIGNLYIADRSNNRIRKVTPEGIINTVAGNGQRGFSGDGGPATEAEFWFPLAIDVDGQGSLYISDVNNRRIRKVTPDGLIDTVAGDGNPGSGGDGGPAGEAQLHLASGLAVDAQGQIFVADSSEHRVRVVTSNGIISTAAGNGEPGFGGDNGPAGVAQLHGPSDIAVGPAGELYIADRGNHRIRKLTPNLPERLAVAGGDNQGGPVGAPLPDPLKVEVVGTGGFGVPGITVEFRVTSGSASLKSDTVVTDASGRAAAELIFGEEAGPVTVEATVNGLPVATFTLTSTRGTNFGVGRPFISPEGVVGAGLSVPRVRQIAPHGLVSIFGGNFTLESFAATPQGPFGGELPKKLGGICVQVGDALAPILHVFPSHVTAQVPPLADLQQAPVRVIKGCGTTAAVLTNAEVVPVQTAAPEFFFYALNADGVNPVAAVEAVTLRPIGPSGLIPGTPVAPARPGDIVSLSGTGFGETRPSNHPFFDALVLVAPVTVKLGEWELEESDVLFAGAAPGLPGVYNIVLRIPDDADTGDISVSVQVGDFSTPPGAFLAIGPGEPDE